MVNNCKKVLLHTWKANRFSFLSVFWLLLTLSGCDTYPQDPKLSLAEARNDTLIVGAIESAPHLLFEKGIEAELIRGFAGSIGAKVEWVTGSEEELMPLLQTYELHLVAGGIVKSTPWKKHIALTRPYRKEKIVVVNTAGESVPEEIEGLPVGVPKGSVMAAYVKKKGGFPLYLESLRGYKGLIAIPEHQLEDFGSTDPSLTIHTKEYVLALPKGENNLLMTLDNYIYEAGFRN